MVVELKNIKIEEILKEAEEKNNQMSLKEPNKLKAYNFPTKTKKPKTAKRYVQCSKRKQPST